MRKKLMRQFCIVLALVLAFTLVSACRNEPTPDTAPPPTPDSPSPEIVVPPPVAQDPLPIPSAFNEAPMLAEKVAAGTLPRVDDRLPVVPKIADDLAIGDFVFEIGKYGGTLRHGSFIPNVDLQAAIGNTEPLVTAPGIYGDIITPNLVFYEVSADQKTFTFTLREGHKWSDGELLTTDDVAFAWFDVMLNEEITDPQAIPPYLRDGGVPGANPGTMTIIDEHTFQISFSVPYGGFLVNLAIVGWRNYVELIKPKHYLMQYHATYADPGELAKLMDEGDHETWAMLFGEHDVRNILEYGGSVRSIGFPTLSPWMCIFNDSTTYRFERNPYYFKIDPEGNQLPYIDYFESTFYGNMDTFMLAIAAGDVDYTSAGEMPYMEMFVDNAEQNGYYAHVMSHFNTPAVIAFNYTYDDDNFQEVVGDIRFRQALSYAINRNDINDALYWGMGTLTSWNDPEYNPDKANALLDEMGLDRKDSAGFRLGPDGKRFTVNLEFPVMIAGQDQMMQMIQNMWHQVGVFTDFKVMDMTLFNNNWNANDVQVTLRNGSFNFWWMDELLQAFIGAEWWRWFTTNGDLGIEPPEEVLTYFNLIAGRMAQSIEEIVNVTFPSLRRMNNEHYFYIVIIDRTVTPLIANRSLRGYNLDGFAMANSFAIEQYWYDTP